MVSVDAAAVQEQDISLVTGGDATPLGFDTTPKVNYASFTHKVVGQTLKLTVTTTRSGSKKGTITVTNAKGKPVPGVIYASINGVTDKIYVDIKHGPYSLEALLATIPKP